MYEGQALMIAGKYDLPSEMIELLSQELMVDVGTHTVKDMENRFARALQKHSGCGLSFSFIKPHDMRISIVTELWWTEIVRDGSGARVVAIWKDGELRTPLATVPRVVRAFFSLIPHSAGNNEDPNPSNDKMNANWSSVKNVKKGARVPHVEHYADRMIAKAEIEIPVTKFIPGGVGVNSVVEGTQGTDIHRRFRPFTAKEFYEMLKDVEEEAKSICVGEVKDFKE